MKIIRIFICKLVCLDKLQLVTAKSGKGSPNCMADGRQLQFPTDPQEPLFCILLERPLEGERDSSRVVATLIRTDSATDVGLSRRIPQDFGVVHGC
jgi:hypothetical protein